MTRPSHQTLSDFALGAPGVILTVRDDGTLIGDTASSTIARRLRELGFVPGAPVEVIARMLPGGEPIAVRVAGATFALRRREADQVEVEQAP